MSVSHSFSVEVACVVGDRKATILNNFSHWHLKNGADGHHVFDGYVWTYNSITAFAKVWPYLTLKQVRICLDSLEKEGYLKTGNYNEWKTDQTKWYALTEKACELMKIAFLVELVQLPKTANGIARKGKSNGPFGQMELPEKADGFAQKGRPIPSFENTLENQLENPPPPEEEIKEESEVVADVEFERIKAKLNEARSEVLRAQSLLNTTCMSLKITRDFYAVLVNAFYDEQIGFAEAKKSIDLYRIKDHQANWLRSQVKLGPQGRFHPDFKPIAPVSAYPPRNGQPAPTVISKLTSAIPD